MNHRQVTQFTDYITTPIGFLWIEANEQGLFALTFKETRVEQINPNAMTELAKQQLLEYFSEKRRSFSIPLAATGTEFQQSVWQALGQIPFGETCSYLDIAKSIGNPKACRAVGAANGKNPIPIIVPCHRVIGSNQKLTGFAGGLDRKAWLLTHENALQGADRWW